MEHIGKFDDHVQRFLDAELLGQRREDIVSMISDLSDKIRLVRVGAFPRGDPRRKTIAAGILRPGWLGRLRPPQQRRAEHGSEVGVDQALILALGYPFGQCLE